ncbi:uncharacterized protein [Lepisosteus oculatus]|uniref:uncharacterized protein n=1 Tax=Lepisosteus oculatus TaxID=7918 RepID=UPI0035F5069A
MKPCGLLPCMLVLIFISSIQMDIIDQLNLCKQCNVNSNCCIPSINNFYQQSIGWSFHLVETDLKAINQCCVNVSLNIPDGITSSACKSLAENITNVCLSENNFTDHMFCVIFKDCLKAYTVQIKTNSTEVPEGNDLTLSCANYVPKVTQLFYWFKDDQFLKLTNSSNLTLRNVLQNYTGMYHCTVKTPCLNLTSNKLHITVKSDGFILLLLCGLAAGIFVFGLAVMMRCILKKSRAQNTKRNEMHIYANAT